MVDKKVDNNVADEILKCGFCGRRLADSHKNGKKDITIRCPKCGKDNKF
jgi:DNA-directed RNA polymerase subunit RPC12/RpoP